MKLLKYIPLLLLFSCTKNNFKINTLLQWKHITSSELRYGKVEEKRSELLSQSDNLEFKIIERSVTADEGIKQYEDLKKPFAEMMSKKIKCTTKKKTIEELSSSSSDLHEGFLVYADDKMAVESCPPAKPHWSLLQLVVHCPISHMIYEIKVYERGSSFEHLREIFNSFSCR